MRRVVIIGGAVVVAIVGLVFALVALSPARTDPGSASTTAPAAISPAEAAAPGAHAGEGFLYGRITTDGPTYEGRLRWGGDQEASWGDYFDGAKSDNRWAEHAPLRRSDSERFKVEIFGFEFGGPDRSHLERRFLTRFGDIARIVRHFKDVQVTLKSGTIVMLDRFEAGDIDDGVRVWDRTRGEVNVDAGEIRTIEFLPTAPLAGAPGRLHGVVRTQQGEFTGFVAWDQYDGVSTDTLDGRTSEGEQSLRYDTIRSIARASRESALVTLRDGREIELSRTREAGRGHRGVYVDDARYGRVLISWDVFERIEFSSGGSGPAYRDFAPGQPLAGSVATRDGRRLTGRLVYDFDESETTETLDVSFKGIDYGIPFGMIAAIVPPERSGAGSGPGRVILRDGGELRVERGGDIGDGNAGMLIFVAGRERPEYVPWREIQQIDFDDPTAEQAYTAPRSRQAWHSGG